MPAQPVFHYSLLFFTNEESHPIYYTNMILLKIQKFHRSSWEESPEPLRLLRQTPTPGLVRGGSLKECSSSLKEAPGLQQASVQETFFKDEKVEHLYLKGVKVGSWEQKLKLGEKVK